MLVLGYGIQRSQPILVTWLSRRATKVTAFVFTGITNYKKLFFRTTRDIRPNFNRRAVTHHNKVRTIRRPKLNQNLFANLIGSLLRKSRKRTILFNSPANHYNALKRLNLRTLPTVKLLLHTPYHTTLRGRKLRRRSLRLQRHLTRLNSRRIMSTLGLFLNRTISMTRLIPRIIRTSRRTRRIQLRISSITLRTNMRIRSAITTSTPIRRTMFTKTFTTRRNTSRNKVTTTQVVVTLRVTTKVNSKVSLRRGHLRTSFLLLVRNTIPPTTRLRTFIRKHSYRFMGLRLLTNTRRTMRTINRKLTILVNRRRFPFPNVGHRTTTLRFSTRPSFLHHFPNVRNPRNPTTSLTMTSSLRPRTRIHRRRPMTMVTLFRLPIKRKRIHNTRSRPKITLTCT